MSRLLLLLAVAVPVVANAGDRKPVVAVLPVKAATPELYRLGLLMEARASSLLVAQGNYSTLDMKQVLAMAGQEGLDPAQLSDDANADKALGLLGADRVVAVTLTGDASGLTVQGSVRDGRQPAAFSAKLPGAWASALTQGSEAIARALLERDKAALPAGAKAQPESSSDAALKALGVCWETALRQPMGIDAPVGLSGADLDAALNACRAALKTDGSLRFAGATLGLLLAIAREDAEAEKVLGAPADTDAALMPWVLARFWLLTRNKSNEAAVGFLTAVVKKHPGVLVLRSFQANTLASMNEHARAVAAWNEYLALTPASSFAQGRMSRSLARQDKHDLALAAAKKGLELAPQGREARVVLAARQLDAGKLADAKATLQPLVALPNAPAEPLLHLGLAYQAAGDLKSAAPMFQLASERASGPKAWRTKGRALYHLALLEAKQGHADAAKLAFSKSRETGFVMSPPDPLLADIVKSAGEPQAVVAPATSGALYLNVEPLDRTTPLPPASSALVDTVLHDKLASMGATFAPPNEDKKAAVAAIKAKSLKAYQLRVQVTPSADGAGLKVDMLVMSYPEQALKGNWTVKASGKKQESLIKAMVARVVDDAAGDLDWKN